MQFNNVKASIRKPYRLTKSGIASLKNRLEELQHARQTNVKLMRTVQEEQADDVMFEDSSFIQALSTIRFLEVEIDKIRHILANAVVVRKRNKKGQRVSIGSRVHLESAGKRLEYTIVNSIEADPSSGKISDESPLGQQLLGKKPHDFITLINAPKQKSLLFKLVSVN